ncbi:hypothetical protein F4827_006570 [Paraburkholderia bannensis]|uniref:Uncharacterized protein n=1 Tax=Paraburkholderia bannensis TaxID=765414 RepID=A0A7W9WWB4_9BURK|nr:hypothetical protein [Paraburkholderia sp. WP4_3_2]MBB6106694.1 hypothetical protein [Paraburkholderia bannensis]
MRRFGFEVLGSCGFAVMCGKDKGANIFAPFCVAQNALTHCAFEDASGGARVTPMYYLMLVWRSAIEYQAYRFQALRQTPHRV